MSTTPRVLFILKKRPSGPYSTWSFSADGKPLPSGLSVSVDQLSKGLEKLGISHKVVQVIDNNCIDREVTEFKPTHVVIEAFWVVPEKFDILRKLHPTVHWIVRNHSKSDFLSHEGGMLGWAIDYISKGITLACNSPEAMRSFKQLAVDNGYNPRHVVFLPNYYNAPGHRKSRFLTYVWKLLRAFGVRGRSPHTKVPNEISIGCFGAIRPLKNHMNQALAAIQLAARLGLKLNFYINATRIEGKADSILIALRALFARHPQHSLIEVEWHEHAEFLEEMKKLDLLLQVSNSETFNIVAADAVAVGVPVLASSEIPWLEGEFYANPNRVDEIARKAFHVWRNSGNGYLQNEQLMLLRSYCKKSLYLWEDFLLHC